MQWGQAAVRAGGRAGCAAGADADSQGADTKMEGQPGEERPAQITRESRLTSSPDQKSIIGPAELYR